MDVRPVIAALLTLGGLLVTPSISTRPTPQKPCGSPPMKRMYPSHEGSGIATIGLRESEISEVFSEVFRSVFVREMGINSAIGELGIFHGCWTGPIFTSTRNSW